jgi:membrane protease YdiL (CAAX protease family)
VTDSPPDGMGGPDPESHPVGRPGASIFSLEGRPAAGLYLVSWLLTGLGLAALIVAGLTGSQVASAVLSVAAILLLTGGLASGAGHQVLARRSRTAAAYRGPSPPLLFALVVAGSLLVLVPLVAAGLPLDSGPGLLLQALVLGAGYLLSVYFLVVRTGALGWREMTRLPVPRIALGQPLAAAIGAVVLMVPVNLGLTLTAGLLAAALDAVPASPLPAVRSTADFLAIALALVVVAPVAEEIFFRGFAVTAWARDLGPVRALVRSTLFFGLIHLIDPGAQAGSLREAVAVAVVLAVIYLPLGGLFGWLYQRAGLLPAIAAHASFNATTLVLALLAGRLSSP